MDPGGPVELCSIRNGAQDSQCVMAGLVPANHVLLSGEEDVDGRDGGTATTH
jgi:hypothetical protein